MDTGVKKLLFYICWDDEINANESFMLNLLSTIQTMNLNQNSSSAERLPAVALVASLTPKWNSRSLRLCTPLNSGHISRHVWYHKSKACICYPEGFLVDWCTVWKCDSLEKHGTAHVLIGSAVMNARCYPGQVGEVNVRISALQTEKISTTQWITRLCDSNSVPLLL